ncbi:MAG: hypothetical protein M3N68_14080, partial [Actinomycetota bacterium]|nr:hypothetical protein [Actinomycetota bacterium]
AGPTAEVASTAAEQGRAVATTAARRGQAVATVAADDARQLAGAAKEQASGVVAEASEVMTEVLEQGRELLDTAKAELEEQLQAQATRLAEGLARFGDEAQRLAAGRGIAEQAVAKVNDAADALFEVADDVASRGLEGLVSDVGSFARRRPGAFLVGAAAVGFGVGRVVRGALSDDDADEDDVEEAAVAPSTPARRRVGAGGGQ